MEALTACLSRCGDAALMRRLAENARGFVVANYSAEAMARAYQALYEKLLHGRRAA